MFLLSDLSIRTGLVGDHLSRDLSADARNFPFRFGLGFLRVVIHHGPNCGVAERNFFIRKAIPVQLLRDQVRFRDLEFFEFRVA